MITKLGDGYYRIFISAGRHPVTGKRRRITERFHGTYRDAQRRDRELRTSLDQGSYVARHSQTFRDFVENEWWPTKLPNISPTTARGYRSLLDCHILPAFGSIYLQKISPSGLVKLISSLVAAGKITTARRAHVLVGTICRAAIAMGAAGRNPVEGVEVPRSRRVEMPVLTPAQVRLALDDLADRDSWALVPITLLVTTGLRRSELAGLRWGDIDFERGILAVQRSYHVLPGGKTYVRSPKTNRGRRSVALDRQTAAALSEHKTQARQIARMFDRDLEQSDWIFARPDGTPWPPDTYTQLWGRTARRLGFSVTLHGLRHTSASLLLAAGVNARLISSRLGHATVGFTLDQYSHLLPNADEEAAEQLAALLSEPKREIPAAS